MADIHIDIERMIMHSKYLLEVDNSSASNGLSDMERKQYLDQIKELVQTVQTLLDANIALGNKQRNYRQRQIVRLPVCRLRLTSLLENCKPVGVRCMARTKTEFLQGIL